MLTFASVQRICGRGRIWEQRGGVDPFLMSGFGLGLEIGVKRICGMRNVPSSKEASVLLGLACLFCLLTGDAGLLLMSALERGVCVDRACQGEGRRGRQRNQTERDSQEGGGGGEYERRKPYRCCVRQD